MNLQKENVTLKRLKEEDIEMVRIWRNDPKISQYMSFRDYITPEMQKKWFEKINNDNNYFFIINIDGKDIGLTEIKNIDFALNEAESGIFIYDDNYLNSIYPYVASYLLLNFAFQNLKIKTVKAQVLDDNKRAVKYNKSLGFILTEDLAGNLRKYILDEKTFNKTKQIIEIVIR